MTLIKIFIGIVKLISLRPKIEQTEKRNDGRSWDTLILQTGSNLHELLKAVFISLQKSSLFYVVLQLWIPTIGRDSINMWTRVTTDDRGT